MFSKPVINQREPLPRKDIRSLPGQLGSTVMPPNSVPLVNPAKASSPLEEVPVDNKEGRPAACLIVGPEVKLKGAEILDCDTLVVEGRVEATMDSRVIRIAEQGAFSGKVSIDIAEIHGSFDGELSARSQLIIHATGKVSGKIRYGRLLIAEGGELRGEINTLAGEKSGQAVSARNDGLPTLSAVGG